MLLAIARHSPGGFGAFACSPAELASLFYSLLDSARFDPAYTGAMF